MEPEKIHDIEEITAMHLPKKQSEGYWYDNADSDIRNYITGRDDLSLSGIGRFGLKRAKNEYMSLGNTFRRKSLSAPEMAKYENKYHIDQSLFDVARDEIGRDYNIDAEKYQAGRMSDRRWNRKSQRYDQQMKNLNENQYILDQQQNPLRYARPHQRGDTAPLLFSLGFPLAVIGAFTALTNPATYTNFVLPVLGGEIVNETTRKLSDNKYDSFGDFVYRSTPLDNWTKDTWLETPTKFFTDMSNPAYWAPYGKIAQTIGPIIDKSISSTAGNIIGEIARRSKSVNLRNFANASDLVPAKLPHLYRAIGRMSDYAAGGWDNVSGKFSKYFRLNGAGRKTATTSNNIVNFTTDQKVINHVADPSKGWDQSDVIVFPRSFTEKVLPYIRSTAPMDTFIQLEQKIAIPKKQLWKITGDINKTHFKRISSKKLKSEFKPFAETTNLPGYNHSNNSFLTKVGGGKHWKNITDAQNEIIWRRFGRPLEKDIKLLEEKTGLPSGIIKPSEFQIYVDDLISNPRMGPEFMDDPGFSITRSRVAGQQNLPSDYKYIYNPYIEFMFREYPKIYKNYINEFKIFKSRLPKINIKNYIQKRIIPTILYNTVNSNND